MLSAHQVRNKQRAAVRRREDDVEEDEITSGELNLAPYLDLLFGTYHRPRGPETYPLGLTEPWPRRYLAQLARPFRPGPRGPGPAS